MSARELETPGECVAGEAGAGARGEAAGGGAPVTEEVNVTAGSGCGSAAEDDEIGALG